MSHNQNDRRPRLGLIGFCSDKNSSFRRGAAEAPPLIRAALVFRCVEPLERIRNRPGWEDVFFDAGDVTTDSINQIEQSVDALLAQGLHPLALGGDHSITFPIIKAVARAYPALSILHFDAHPDLYHDFRGNPYSHASPFARIMEAQLVAASGPDRYSHHERSSARTSGAFRCRSNRDEGSQRRFRVEV